MSSWSALRKYSRFILFSFGRNMASAMEYRSSFVIQIVSSIFFCLGFFAGWYFLIGAQQSINGWTIADTARVFAIGWGAIDGSSLFFYGIQDLSVMINSGKLDNFLNYPLHPLVLIAMTKCRPSSLGSIPVCFLFLFVAGDVTLLTLVMYIVYSLLGMIVWMNLLIIAQVGAFWTGGFDRLIKQIMFTMINSIYIPYTVFSPVARLLTKTVLPSFFIATLPAQLLGRFELEGFLLLVAFAIGSTVLSLTLFNAGLKRYESGNLIGNS